MIHSELLEFMGISRLYLRMVYTWVERFSYENELAEDRGRTGVPVITRTNDQKI